MQVVDSNGRLKVEITNTVDDLSVGVTTISGGTNGRVLYDNAGVLGELDLASTYVPLTRTLTINGTTQDLSADRTFTISTGITIGTTAITSGTVGRVLFEGTGNVVQQSSSLFWDATNNRLGVGTSSPTQTLDIQPPSGTATIRVARTGGTDIRMGASIISTGGLIGTYSASPLILLSNSAEAMRLFTTGNIGINTTTDAGFRLDVNGTARVQGALTLSAASPSITLGGDLTITSTAYPSRVASYDTLNSNLNLIAGGFGEGMFIGNRLTGSRTSTTFVSPDGLNAVGSAKITAYDGNGNTNIQASNNGNRSIVLRGLGAGGSVLIGNITTGNGTQYTSILTLESTTQGFLPPRMTTTQKNAIATPAAGLMVYDTTLNLMSVYNGTTWITL